MKTATHGTDEGRSRLKRIACSNSAPTQTDRDGNRKSLPFSVFFVHRLYRWAGAHKACPLSVDLSPFMRAHRAKSSRGFDQKSVGISDRSVVRSKMVDADGAESFERS